ncbi:hypothetical protein G6F24_018772 [Rhizopus arrhizus]|nr:hypothetical protein G6F24_018772 [Rhizopus arrhizus]
MACPHGSAGRWPAISGVSMSTALTARGYQSGFGNEFATEAVAADRHRVYRAARQQSPQLAVPDTPGGHPRRVHPVRAVAAAV